MAIYCIPITYQVCGMYFVEAKTLEEAKEFVYDLDLPEKPEYVEDSFSIDSEACTSFKTLEDAKNTGLFNVEEDVLYDVADGLTDQSDEDSEEN